MTFRRLNASVLSPLLLFPLAWVLVALLAQVHILDIQGPWSTVMVAVVAAVPLAFVSGGLIGEGIALVGTAAATGRSQIRIRERTFRRIMVVLVGIGLLAVAYQFARAGRPPLLSGSIDDARFSEGGPTILFTDLLTVAMIVAMTRARNPFARESRFELALSVVALGAFALQAGRGNVVLPVVVVIIARWLYWGRPSPYLIAVGALAAFLVICFGFYLRTYQHPTTPFEAELFGEVLPSLPFFIKPLIPIYLALTTNFVGLEGIIHHFPTAAQFGHGAYDAVALDRFIPGSEHIGDVSGELTPPWVTSTVAGALWADGGFPVLVPGVAVTGMLAAGAYAAAARTRSFRWSMVAAYLIFLSLFGLYTNLWTQQIDWLIVTPLLFVFGAFCENAQTPPGLVGAAWGKIRRVQASKSSAAAVADRPTPATAAEDPGGGRRRGAIAAIVCGVAAIVVLLVAGLIIQRTLPEPFKLSKTMHLPDSVARAEAVFGDSGRTYDNTLVWWVNRTGATATLRYFDPATERAHFATRFRPVGSAAATSYDTGFWAPVQGPALFEMRQAPKRLYIYVRRSDNGKIVRRYSTRIGAPAPGVDRFLEIASFGGPRSDLISIDRGLESSRVRLGVLSGESNFKIQAFGTYLPFRGLKPDHWSIGTGELAGKTLANGEQAPPRTDLMLIQRDPGREHADLKVLPGEEQFNGFAYQRDIDEPGDISARRTFLQGAWESAPSIFEIVPEAPGGPQLRIFDIQAPAGLL
jgi:hypothetical protein